MKHIIGAILTSIIQLPMLFNLLRQDLRGWEPSTVNLNPISRPSIRTPLKQVAWTRTCPNSPPHLKSTSNLHHQRHPMPLSSSRGLYSPAITSISNKWHKRIPYWFQLIMHLPISSLPHRHLRELRYRQPVKQAQLRKLCYSAPSKRIQKKCLNRTNNSITIGDRAPQQLKMLHSKMNHWPLYSCPKYSAQNLTIYSSSHKVNWLNQRNEGWYWSNNHNYSSNLLNRLVEIISNNIDLFKRDSYKLLHRRVLRFLPPEGLI